MSLSEGKYKGVAVLFHGFTACPSQWSQITTLLSERGYEILVPLLPGHGDSLPWEKADFVMRSKTRAQLRMACMIAPFPSIR